MQNFISQSVVRQPDSECKIFQVILFESNEAYRILHDRMTKLFSNSCKTLILLKAFRL